MIRGRDFLDAVTFLNDLQTEVSARTRTGRAYYAAYLEARSYCVTNFGYEYTRTAREHIDVPSLLRTLDTALYVDLRFLRQLRNAADYELDLSDETILHQAPQAISMAERIIARLDEMSPGA